MIQFHYKVVITLWEFLDKFNTATGFVMFFVTLGNLALSLRINKRIHSAVDLQKLKNDKDAEISKVKSLIRLIDLDEKISVENRNRILKFLTELRARYPDIKKLNQKKLLTLVKSEKCDYLQVREKLQRLITEIERIA